MMTDYDYVLPSWRYQVVEWVCMDCKKPLSVKAEHIDVDDDGLCPLYALCECGVRYKVTWGDEHSVVTTVVFG